VQNALRRVESNSTVSIRVEEQGIEIIRAEKPKLKKKKTEKILA
jgi:flagellar biosynthesis/type III secretory pathway protein FliH